LADVRILQCPNANLSAREYIVRYAEQAVSTGNEWITVDLGASKTIDKGKYFKVDNIFARHAVMIEDFNAISDWGYAVSADMTASAGIATITNTSGTSGSVSKYLSYNVDDYPNVMIDVTQVGSGATWAAKVDDGATNYYLQGNTSIAGTLSYDLKSITGWNGAKTFKLQLIPAGGTGKFFKLDQIDIYKR
jgi:hypothetical protein